MCSRPLLGGMVHSYVLISRPCRSRLKVRSQPVGVAESSFTCVQRSWACLDSELLVPLGWAGLGRARLSWAGLDWAGLSQVEKQKGTFGAGAGAGGLGLELRDGTLYNRSYANRLASK